MMKIIGDTVGKKRLKRKERRKENLEQRKVKVGHEGLAIAKNKKRVDSECEFL